MRANSMKSAKIMSDKFAQFYGDERIKFECFYEKQDDRVEFFGQHETNDIELAVCDGFVLKSIAKCPYIVFNKETDLNFTFDPRIREMSRAEFEASLTSGKHESSGDGKRIFKDIDEDEDSGDDFDYPDLESLRLDEEELETYSERIAFALLEQDMRRF